MIRITGLWKNSKDGKSYLSGQVGNVRVLIFPVREKRGEGSPDFDLCIDEARPKDGRQEGAGEDEAPF